MLYFYVNFITKNAIYLNLTTVSINLSPYPDYISQTKKVN